MSESAATSSQVDANYAAFQEKLPEIIATHAGKMALMHDQQIVDFFDSYADAVRFGLAKYNEFGRFSIQEVTSRVVGLGFYSYVGNLQK